jgi:hypothetical protein
MQTKRKPKRKLSDISFEHEGAHIALTSKTLNNGPANGADYALIMKGNMSQEYIEKVQQIRVTMELPEFLRRFFSLYGDDVEILARMMGYEKPEGSDQVEPMESYEDYIQSKLQAYEIMKSVHASENFVESLAALDETEYLALLEDQELLEKSILEISKAYKPKTGDMVEWNSSGGKAKGKVEHVMRQGTLGVPGTEFSITASSEDPAVLIRIYKDGEPTETLVGHRSSTLKKITKSREKQTDYSANEIADESVNSTNASVEKSVEPSGSEEKQMEKSNMTQEVEKDAPTVEMVEKAAMENIQKAFDEQKVALEKALETIAQFEAEKKAVIAKAKTEKIQAVVKDEGKTQILAKAALSLESEDDFTAFVATLEAMQKTVESSEMFVEKGASVEDETQVPAESAVAKVLKAKLAK